MLQRTFWHMGESKEVVTSHSCAGYDVTYISDRINDRVEGPEGLEVSGVEYGQLIRVRICIPSGARYDSRCRANPRNIALSTFNFTVSTRLFDVDFHRVLFIRC